MNQKMQALVDLMKDTAKDIEDPGFDEDSGYGLISVDFLESQAVVEGPDPIPVPISGDHQAESGESKINTAVAIAIGVVVMTFVYLMLR